MDETLVKYVLKPMDNIGLLDSKVKRASFFFAGTATLLFLTQPTSLFNPETRAPYPSKLITDTPDSLVLDWFGISALMGLLSVVLI